MARPRFEIGRRTIYGNPFHAPTHERLLGKTLPNYRTWLWAALNQDAAARLLYKNITSIELPLDYASALRTLGNLRTTHDLWCPGCREHSCQPNICHGSVLNKAIDWLIANPDAIPPFKDPHP